MVNLEQSLGLKVKVTTILDNTITGTIFAYSPTSQLLTLQQDTPSKSDLASYRIIKTEFLKELQVIPNGAKGAAKNGKTKAYQFSSFSKIQPAVHALDEAAITAKVAEKIKQCELALKTTNKNASSEGQEIFNKLYKTLPDVKWIGTDIVVLGEVKIAKPYFVKDISNNAGAKENPLIARIVGGYWLDQENSKKGG
ncbi:hypothetical protein BABINDRAFT_10781 [Babjeviella inositovora NRRL Y-12698]|uniref:AD domain-containing protein n=1 Tax=Babjeviella inositovora NRRL Y-12698 TaxID=984486 RepID=A0A1E3QXC7_9ASCO|nr:uncharacterized protein BABINDRAFT_10781 [Babjeviella inositovora NRRL Y-12698]ODQ82320.1 hypothetical protein BABINDRAFT_10781 [Babjeviella inositovora NRRL Y-12698]